MIALFPTGQVLEGNRTFFHQNKNILGLLCAPQTLLTRHSTFSVSGKRAGYVDGDERKGEMCVSLCAAALIIDK